MSLHCIEECLKLEPFLGACESSSHSSNASSNSKNSSSLQITNEFQIAKCIFAT